MSVAHKLTRGAGTRVADLLKLAMHYIVRGGWTPHQETRVSSERREIGLAYGAITVNAALERARLELCAPWMTSVHANHALYAAAGFRTESPEPFKAWLAAPERTADEIKELFRRCIVACGGDPKGLVADEAA